MEIYIWGIGLKSQDMIDAKTIRRIVCPTINAFDRYNDIKSVAMEIAKDVLILMALGPVGKVLAYELSIEEYQVVDIG